MPIRNHRAWSNKKRVLTTTATVILASVVGPGHAETVVQEFDTVIVIGTTPSPPRIEIPYFTSTYDYRARSGSTFEPTASVGIALEHGDCGGNPVERLGGNKVEFETDFKGGGEMPLVMHRTYHQGATTFNHARALRGILGTQWRTSFDYAVEMQGGDRYGDPVQVTDHGGRSNEAGSHCEKVEGVDEAKVNAQLEIGRPLGNWTYANQCRTFTTRVLWNAQTNPPRVDDEKVLRSLAPGMR